MAKCTIDFQAGFAALLSVKVGIYPKSCLILFDILGFYYHLKYEILYSMDIGGPGSTGSQRSPG